MIPLITSATLLNPPFGVPATSSPSLKQREKIQQELFDAVANGELIDVTKALTLGADPNHVMPNGNYPLHVAVKRMREDMVRALLQGNASPLVKNSQNQMPHDLAVSAYLECKRQYEIKNGSLKPFQLTHEMNQWQRIKDCLTCRAFHTDEQNQKIQEALLTAALEGTTTDIRNATRHGARVDSEMADGNCVLHVAAAKARYDVVHYLLSGGANPLRTNAQGKWAREIAEEALAEARVLNLSEKVKSLEKIIDELSVREAQKSAEPLECAIS